MGRIPNVGTKTFGGVKGESTNRELIEEPKTLSNENGSEIIKLKENRFVRAWKVLIGKL